MTPFYSNPDLWNFEKAKTQHRKMSPFCFLILLALIALPSFGFAQTTTLSYTGASQTYTVPTGVTSILIECWGAQGGSGGDNGGYAKGYLAVTPAQVLNIYVGGQGTHPTGGWNGGGQGGIIGDPLYASDEGYGGGGASDVRVGGTALANRVIVGCGGGGASGANGGGGGGQGTAGGNGTISGGGAGGAGCINTWWGLSGGNGTAGSNGQGGSGGSGGTYGPGGGGGGGGYYGGGGAGGGVHSSSGPKGGSGYSYTGGVTGGTSTSLSRTGNGQIVITVNCNLTLSNSSQTNISCFGGSNGTATISASGETLPYSYSWSPSGGSAATASSLTAGTYTCSVTAGNGCSNSIVVTITQPSALVATSLSQTNISCFGGSNGAASVSVTGGTTSYSYNWTPGNPTGDGTASVTGLTFGTWTCTVTDANACTTTRTFSITQPTALVASALSQTNISCNGGSNGAASVSVTGGTTSYSYNWTPGNPTGDGTASVTGLTFGTWTCTVTDANSCVTTQTFNITQPSALVASAASQTNVSCNSGTNGAASVSVSGGTTSYSYNWTPGNPTGDGTASVTGLIFGNWTCTVTDANSCVTTQTFNITQPSALVASALSQTNISCNGGSNGAASITVSGGTTSYSYNWTPGNPTGDGTASVTGLTFGTWTCTVTDANSCVTTQTFNITQPSAIVLNAASQTNISCNGGSNGAASVTAASGGTGPYTYNWTPGNPTGDGTVSVTGLTFGTWTCTVTDANACTTTRTFSITQPSALVASALSQTNISCNGGSNGAASVSVTGGTTSYSYNWTPGNPTGDGTASVTGLTFGTWTCTVTDANSCVTTQTFNITQPTALVASALSQTNISCNGGSNGAASITVSGGTTSYSYNWTPGNPTGDGTASVTGLTFGTWTCTVTDANSCVTTQTFNITQPTALVASALSQTNVSCNSGSNGAASVSVTGGTTSYSYNWTPGNPNGDGTASVTGLTFGTWTCTVTDANSCVTTQSFNITEPSLLTSTSSQVNVTCNGGNNGSITVNPSGGTAGYTYAWLPIGGNAATANNLIAGIYNCTITDANGCFITPSITVTEPSAITANSTQTNVSCNGGNNGSATIFASGGTGLLSYAWSSGGTNATENNIGAGLYTCTITDANSCFITTSITITAPTAITSSVSILNNVSCYQLLDGSATITASGGTGTLSYSWSPSGGNAASATGLGAGTYVVTINDTHSCTITQSLSITQPIQVVVNANASATTVCYGTLVSLNGTGTATTYNWSGGVTNNVAFVATTTTTYTVTGINGSGCQNTNMITINVNALPTVNANASATTVCAGSMVTLTGGGNSTSYSWSGGVIDGVGFINNTTANYTVTGTDANGCSADANITVNVNPVPIVDLGADQALCSGTVSLDAQNVGSSYSWNDNSTSQTLIAATTGIYWVDVTNANGCSTRDSVAITINTNPVVFLGNDTVLCGGSITLDAGNAGAIYLWSDNSTNQTLNVTTSGVYLVMATLTGGCFAIDTIIVTINSLPNVVFSIIPDSICMNDAAILLSATPIGGSFSGTGVTGSFFNPSTLNGTETITYTFTDSNTGCTSSSSDTIVVDACTGIVDQNGNSNILNVYPNPNTGLFTIDLGYIPNSEVRVDIMNSMGQKVQSFLMKDSVQQVDLGVYETGIYLLRIIDGNNVNVKRVVKE